MEEEINDDQHKPLTPQELTWARFGSGNSDLWLLKCEVEDNKFIRIFNDIAKLIRTAENRCDEAVDDGPREFAEMVNDEEAEYIEELIGAAFLILQAKIRRVSKAAVNLAKEMKGSYEIEIIEPAEASNVRRMMGGYKETDISLVSYVWEIANYFKHREDWENEVWEPDCYPSAKNLKQQIKTRETIEKTGVTRFSTGNMRTCFEFLGVEPYSSCSKLATKIQEWADEVYRFSEDRLEQNRLSKNGLAKQE